MTDIIDAALRAVGGRSPSALPLLFACGVVTSIGPCSAPRYVAVTALTHASRRPFGPAALYALGLIGGYVCLGATVGALTAVRLWSAWIYAALAAGLALSGLRMLLRRHVHDESAPPTSGASRGGALLLGAASVLVVSPCCTPIVAAIAGVTMLGGRATDGVIFLSAFALGHAAPLALAALAGDRLRRVTQRIVASPAPAVIAGTLMVGLGVYFAVLA